ncbi:MAG TPA: ATP-binding protein, partial [Noviherbaspirillum sp.]|nr:ATP-binding protein [Noviherbaspirillum sp.]
VLVDAARFEASLLNLLVNARDAMPAGGTVTISTANVDLGPGEVGRLAPGSYVRVTVKDSGTGMPPEVLDRAFEPFFTTKEVGKGTGLGLSQVYGFIAQSGGEVQVRSKEGKGTTVSMFLPANTGGTASEGKGGTATAAAAQKDVVLVVDDDPDLLDIGAELFRNLGYEVLTARDAAQATSVLRERSDIGILFSDVVMPGDKSGIELARAARSQRPDLRVILASGYPLQALKAAHGELNEFTLMAKPYRLGDLVNTLRAA